MITAPGTAAGQDGRLTIRFLTTGLLALMVALWTLPWLTPYLRQGIVLFWPVLAGLHLLVLGCLTMVAVGASFQLLPAALGAPIRSWALARSTFWIFLVGTLGLVLSFAGQSTRGLAVSAPLVWLALGLFLVNAVAACARRAPDLVSGYLLVAFVSLLIVAPLGLVMALDLGGLFAGRFLVTGPTTHAFLALYGWLLPLIMGVSYRLLPMFGMVHGHQATWGRWILAGSAVSLTVTAGTLLAGTEGWRWGAGLCVAALAAYVWDVARLWRRRLRRLPDVAFRFVFAGLGIILLASLAGLAVAFAPADLLPRARLYTASGILLVLGGLTQVVLGFLHKILPFLHWLETYATPTTAGPVPKTSDLLVAAPSRWGFWGYQAGIALLTAGIALDQGPLTATGTYLLATAGCVVAANLLNVLRR
jgi:hypothetical protein